MYFKKVYTLLFLLISVSSIQGSEESGSKHEKSSYQTGNKAQINIKTVKKHLKNDGYELDTKLSQEQQSQQQNDAKTFERISSLDFKAIDLENQLIQTGTNGAVTRILVQQDKVLQNNTIVISENQINSSSSNVNSLNQSAVTKPCQIWNCKKCVSFLDLNPSFSLEPTDIYPEEHPLYKQQYCEVCQDGYFLHRYNNYATILNKFIKSNYTNIQELVQTLSLVIEPQEACVKNDQKILQATVMISGINLGVYLNDPTFFKGWVLQVMGKYKVSENDLRVIFAKQGSLILNYWFNVPEILQPQGDVTDDVFNSGIDKIIDDTEVTSFDIQQIKKNPITPPVTDPDNTNTETNPGKTPDPQVIENKTDTGIGSNSPNTTDETQNDSSANPENTDKPNNSLQDEKNSIPPNQENVVPQDALNPINPSDQSNPPNPNTFPTDPNTPANQVNPPQKNSTIYTPTNSTIEQQTLDNSQSSSRDLLPIIIAGVLSVVLLIVSAVYMLICRKKKETEDEKGPEQNQNAIMTDQIIPQNQAESVLQKDSKQTKPTQTHIQPMPTLIKSNDISIITRDQSNINSNDQSNINPGDQTSILKDRMNVSKKQPQFFDPAISYIKQKSYYIFNRKTKPVVQETPKFGVGPAQIQSMEEIAKSNIESQKPLKGVQGFM